MLRSTTAVFSCQPPAMCEVTVARRSMVSKVLPPPPSPIVLSSTASPAPMASTSTASTTCARLESMKPYCAWCSSLKPLTISW